LFGLPFAFSAAGDNPCRTITLYVVSIQGLSGNGGFYGIRTKANVLRPEVQEAVTIASSGVVMKGCEDEETSHDGTLGLCNGGLGSSLASASKLDFVCCNVAQERSLSQHGSPATLQFQEGQQLLCHPEIGVASGENDLTVVELGP